MTIPDLIEGLTVSERTIVLSDVFAAIERLDRTLDPSAFVSDIRRAVDLAMRLAGVA